MRLTILRDVLTVSFVQYQMFRWSSRLATNLTLYLKELDGSR